MPTENDKGVYTVNDAGVDTAGALFPRDFFTHTAWRFELQGHR